MNRREKDLIRLEHIFDAIKLVEKFSENADIEELSDNLMMQNAIIRQLGIIGEASDHISSERKKNHSNIEWKRLRDFRNLLVHEYFRVDVGEVWSAIESELPVLKEQIRSLIEYLKDNESNS